MFSYRFHRLSETDAAVAWTLLGQLLEVMESERNYIAQCIDTSIPVPHVIIAALQNLSHDVLHVLISQGGGLEQLHRPLTLWLQKGVLQQASWTTDGWSF